MDKRIEELIEYAKTSLGLNHYSLLTFQICRSVNAFNETIYELRMEWLPPHVKEREEDGLNPEGTAVVDINIHTHQFQNVIFVGGTSFADGSRFEDADKQDIINWVEKETGMEYKKQFQPVKEEKHKYQFEECIDGIKVSPSGSIEIHFEKNGKLTLFSMDGHFPSEDKIQKEVFSLTWEEVEPFARQQVKLMAFPSSEQEKLIPVYGMEEVYVTNDGPSTIPFEFFGERRSYLQVNRLLEWQTPAEEVFEGSSIDLQEEVTAEQAFFHEPHPDTFPITADEQKRAIHAVTTLMQQEFPQDSGTWVLKTLHRDQGYILATVKPATPDQRILERKVKVILDAESLHTVNYIDNNFFLDMYKDYEGPEKITISKEEAYEKMKQEVTITPVYVYDFETGQYILCGKIDCAYGIHAANGRVFLLDNL
ncbi:hypothetical protein [Salibacterium aidingense]|uniref:hypothetical protein n=1 Tax=Salibacterium aidingense TaxID=384933 RepID=UPI003BCC9AFC